MNRFEQLCELFYVSITFVEKFVRSQIFPQSFQSSKQK